MIYKFSKFLYISCGLVFVLAISSCSRLITIKSDGVVIFPAPPDSARIQYLTSFSSSENVVGKRSSFASFVLGDAPVNSITKPYGVEVHGSKIYVSDPGIKGLEIIDLEKHTFRNFIPTGKGELQLPLNCVVDANENLYVADGKRFQIVIFDKTGKYLNCLGEIDNFKPTDVFVTDSLVLVTNLKNNKINVYDKNSLKLKYSFPDVESGDEGYLYSPTNLCAADGKIYVTDFGDFKIKIYDIKGTYIRSVGTYGNALGQMARPKGIAVDKESNLFVVDAGFDNTQIFDKNGKLLMYFGGPYKGPGYMWLPASVAIDYTNMNYFQKFVDESYTLKYLIYVTNQYGPEKVNVYGMIESKKNKTH